MVCPKQDDAQYMIDWFKSMDHAYKGSCDISEQLRNVFEISASTRQSEWQRMFGENSPWSFKGNGKSLSLVWDDDKAKRLGFA